MAAFYAHAVPAPYWEISATESGGVSNLNVLVSVTGDETAWAGDDSLVDDIIALVEALPNVTVNVTSKTTVTTANL